MKRRPRLRPIARALHIIADRLYPEVHWTVSITRGTPPVTMVYKDCKLVDAAYVADITWPT